jgi:hypothetical protein
LRPGGAGSRARRDKRKKMDAELTPKEILNRILQLKEHL